ncbi:hypothetical protein K788_0004067 [Paraburkholderia caribensis MBA4]|uniref:Uncharacterized protein n=1 Tax=Paraburkholderia caribensis MBA4 TaxID=1323664 RepID=A0A0P0R4K6_9BURK|nr:hypothetical protein K788_0004067 [Paraburkholderia caribensis MBA4]
MGSAGEQQSARRQHAHEGSLDCFHSFLTQIFHSNPRPRWKAASRLLERRAIRFITQLFTPDTA